MKVRFLFQCAIVAIILLSVGLVSCGEPAPPPLPPPTPSPAEFIVTDLLIDPVEVAPGEPSTVTVKVSNIGGTTGTYTAILTINEVEEERKDTSIAPGATEVVTFELSEATSGKYDIAIESLERTLTVFEMKKYLLKRDNGVFSGTHTFYDPRGQWVQFSPPVTPFKIQKIFVRGFREDFREAEEKTYTIKIWDEDFSKEIFSCDYPYTKFSTDRTMVEHEVKPEVTVDGDFYVDFIAHSEDPGKGKKPKVAIFIDYDGTVASSEYSGISWIGTIDTEIMSREAENYPYLACFNWIIQVQGTGRKQ